VRCGSCASTPRHACTAGLEIDRKVLADLAVNDANAFGVIAEQAKASIAAA
jgi:ribosomal protein L20